MAELRNNYSDSNVSVSKTELNCSTSIELATEIRSQVQAFFRDLLTPEQHTDSKNIHLIMVECVRECVKRACILSIKKYKEKEKEMECINNESVAALSTGTWTCANDDASNHRCELIKSVSQLSLKSRTTIADKLMVLEGHLQLLNYRIDELEDILAIRLQQPEAQFKNSVVDTKVFRNEVKSFVSQMTVEDKAREEIEAYKVKGVTITSDKVAVIDEQEMARRLNSSCFLEPELLMAMDNRNRRYAADVDDKLKSSKNDSILKGQSKKIARFVDKVFD